MTKDSASLLQSTIDDIQGRPTELSRFDGQVVLVVNVASQCGLTPQYDGLEALYRQYRDRGFVVLGFPANDFGAQEPGSNAEIAEFCRSVYGVEFPMMSKVAVTGPGKHPFYAAMIAQQPAAKGRPENRPTPPEGEVRWNFEKFLIGRDGKVVGRFDPSVVPNAPELVQAIEAAL